MPEESLKELVLLDTTGLVCPEPVMMLHRMVKRSPSGQLIRVIATDPATKRDIPSFCQHLGHELIENALEQQPPFIYLIKRK